LEPFRGATTSSFHHLPRPFPKQQSNNNTTTQPLGAESITVITTTAAGIFEGLDPGFRLASLSFSSTPHRFGSVHFADIASPAVAAVAAVAADDDTLWESCSWLDISDPLLS
jgi:hypothetical protein